MNSIPRTGLPHRRPHRLLRLGLSGVKRARGILAGSDGRMVNKYRLRERGPMERMLSASITRIVPASVIIYLILNAFHLPSATILAILGGLLVAGGIYLHLLAQVRIADAVTLARNTSHDEHDE